MPKTGPSGGSIRKNSQTASKHVRFGSAEISGIPLLSVDNGLVSTSAVGSVTNRKTTNGSFTSPESLVSFIRQVKRALRRRPDDFQEFATAVADILRATSEQESDARSSGRAKVNQYDIINRIERLVALLDGHPDLVNGLTTILPSEYSIDVQPHAVVVKVYDIGGDYSMVDTGHSRTNESSDVTIFPSGNRPFSLTANRSTRRRQVPSAILNRAYADKNRRSSSSRSPVRRAINLDLPPMQRLARSEMTFGGVFSTGTSGSSANRLRSASSRGRRTAPGSSPIGRRSSLRRRGLPSTSSGNAESLKSSALLHQLQARQHAAVLAKASRDRRQEVTQASGGTAYISDVKRSLSRHPDVYNKFLGLLKRYHEQLNGGNTSSGSSTKRSSSNNEDNKYKGQESDDDNEISSAGGELETIREVVTLLRGSPQLVLAFNSFLPDGFRIRMFDESAYVIEYPRSAVVTGTGGICAGVGRLTVTV